MAGGINSNAQWCATEELLQAGLPTITRKITIGDHDIYMKIGIDDRRPVFIDITIGRSGGDAARHDACAAPNRQCIADELATRVVDGARAQLEIICRQASVLLQANVWNIEDLVQEWRGTRFEPSGPCIELEMIAKSPLDAAAAWCTRDAARWLEWVGASA